MNLESFRQMTLPSAIEAEITKLEEVKQQLSRLSEGAKINWCNYEGCFPKMEELSPIVDALNTVIQDLKNSIGSDSCQPENTGI